MNLAYYLGRFKEALIDSWYYRLLRWLISEHNWNTHHTSVLLQKLHTPNSWMRIGKATTVTTTPPSSHPMSFPLCCDWLEYCCVALSKPLPLLSIYRAMAVYEHWICSHTELSASGLGGASWIWQKVKFAAIFSFFRALFCAVRKASLAATLLFLAVLTILTMLC